jgi:uncharacterized membrane protein (UPF0127 family)/biotin carboxylase
MNLVRFGGGHSVSVEVANTTEAVLTGLSGRDSLDPDGGMVLVWPAPGRLRVWMKDTRVPLDAVFVGPFGRIVGIERGLVPLDETLRGPLAPARYVVELPAGSADRYGLAVGQPVAFEGPDALPAPPRPSRTVVLVDAMRVGSTLAAELNHRGACCLAVHSSTKTDRKRTDDTQFERVLTNEGDLDAVVAALRPYAPDVVLASTETGVRVADALAHALGAQGNDWALREARRDKFEMVEACRRAGLRVARQVRVTDPESALAWRRAAGLGEVVVKPLDSAGGDGVALCRDDAELWAAVQRLVGQPNRLGGKNAGVVVQERLLGTEYMVNGASLGADHRFADVWRYVKGPLNGAPVMYDTNELLDPADPVYDELIAYTARVLDAVGVRIGPSHTEVMLGPDGPALVEIGARFDGITIANVWRECVGVSAVDLVAEALLDPEAFRARPVKPDGLRRHARTVHLHVKDGGVVREVPGRQTLAALPSFRSLLLNVAEGSVVAPSRDFFSTAGAVLLAHPEESVVQADREAVRRLEAEGRVVRIERPKAAPRSFAQREDVHQSEGFRRAMRALGWTLLDVGGDVGYARQFPDGWFVKVLRARKLDLKRIAAVQRQTPATWAIEPGLEVDVRGTSLGFRPASRRWAYDVTMIRPVSRPAAPADPLLRIVPFEQATAADRELALQIRNRSNGGHRPELLEQVPGAFGRDGWFCFAGQSGVAWVVLHDGVATSLDLHADPDFPRWRLLAAAFREAWERGAEWFDLGGGTEAPSAGWTEVRYPPGWTLARV